MTQNPFTGLNRVVFAVDEWQHKVKPRLPSPLQGVWYSIWRPFCNWWDHRLCDCPEEFAKLMEDS